ncbi:BatA domain-containing protein [Subsaxibacter sp. CAU 1640]|uniref:BatA domain-containing protein n=1 Tax=Subsaxibacter sp. CAU 1640 TaxID=2933271 RepID=UPI002003279A|nr:BatA domain-containing protein [Subsaxibacter sp. CAU 1640]MCK7591102.1 BatA domain-containing protein [Subsaxibacter sp. CAU 1640]
MQFKHPEILYALLLLVIPIIVHLFQLRRFQKVEFTNVEFLKKITLQTRKSSQLKKWLTLLTRLLLLACAIIAFAQPYLADSNTFNAKSETVIYLDNSFSMQAKSSNGSLLNKAVQDLIETMDDKEQITLFTNDNTFVNTTTKAIKNDLIQLKHSPNQLSYEAVVLKGKNAFSNDKSSIKNLILISDFQQKDDPFSIEKDSLVRFKLVQLKPENLNNVSIDTIFISNFNVDNLELTVNLNNEGAAIETLPVSLYNNDNLVAKSAVSIEDKAETTFTIPLDNAFDGKIIIEDTNLQYDNSLYFNINQREKIKVLSIYEADDVFLRKIYTDDEFEYTSVRFNELNYNTLESQNLIVLNELKDIPNSLTIALKSFTENGGYLVTIPSSESSLTSYNQLFANYSLPSFNNLISSEKKITNINFSHPLLMNVFDKKVSNFQYPRVGSFFPTNSNSSSVLSYEDGASFLSEANHSFAFSSPLNEDNSNFKNSPLIVPVLYNIGKQSLKVPQLYYTIGQENTIDISTQLSQDNILTLVVDEHSVVPLQQTYTNKVELKTSEYPDVAGILAVNNKETTLQHLSYNYNRNESNLSYFNLSDMDDLDVQSSVASAIEDIKSATNVNELWKWFVIFALIFLIIEMLILKFLK